MSRLIVPALVMAVLTGCARDRGYVPQRIIDTPPPPIVSTPAGIQSRPSADAVRSTPRPTPEYLPPPPTTESPFAPSARLPRRTEPPLSALPPPADEVPDPKPPTVTPPPTADRKDAEPLNPELIPRPQPPLPEGPVREPQPPFAQPERRSEDPKGPAVKLGPLVPDDGPELTPPADDFPVLSPPLDAVPLAPPATGPEKTAGTEKQDRSKRNGGWRAVPKAGPPAHEEKAKPAGDPDEQPAPTGKRLRWARLIVMR